jgi:hypothetical protein
MEPSRGGTDVFHDRRYGPAGKIVPAWVDEMLHT